MSVLQVLSRHIYFDVLDRISVRADVTGPTLLFVGYVVDASCSVDTSCGNQVHRLNSVLILRGKVCQSIVSYALTCQPRENWLEQAGCAT
jgi:hypothetical protein